MIKQNYEHKLPFLCLHPGKGQSFNHFLSYFVTLYIVSLASPNVSCLHKRPTEFVWTINMFLVWRCPSEVYTYLRNCLTVQNKGILTEVISILSFTKRFILSRSCTPLPQAVKKFGVGSVLIEVTA